MAITSLSQLMNTFSRERTSKLGAGETALREVINLFSPDYGKGEEQATLAGIQADLASRGLANTTVPSAMSIGVKQRTSDIRKTRLADALSMLANFLGQTAPTAPTIGSLATNTNQALRASNQIPYGPYVPPTMVQKPKEYGATDMWGPGGIFR